jgi:hypothetical protein
MMKDEIILNHEPMFISWLIVHYLVALRLQKFTKLQFSLPSSFNIKGEANTRRVPIPRELVAMTIGSLIFNRLV